jgi:SAM-dependent methyltransferase
MFRAMQSPLPLTDRAALVRNRARADRAALFLHDEVKAEVQERLAEVNRAFTKIAVVTPFPAIWEIPGATVVADDDVLALEPGQYDLVIHALAMHWANDPVGQLVQSRRALMPDGLFLGFLFGGQTVHELRACLAQAEAEVTGGLSPRVLPMGEIRDLGALLQRAGFSLPVADSFTKIVTYSDFMCFLRDLRAMGEANALSARPRHTMRRSILARAAALYATHHGQPDGRISATFEIIGLTGWSPHESQQKPLRPGSAAQRLADALGTAELRVPDTGPNG